MVSQGNITVVSQKNFDANSEFADAWKKDNDAGGNSDAPRPVVGDQGPAFGGYITKYAIPLLCSVRIMIVKRLRT